MSEMEKHSTNSILDTLNKLSDAKGSEYTEGLIAGINIGMVSSAPNGPDGQHMDKSGT